jgi:hypothetical protein
MPDITAKHIMNISVCLIVAMLAITPLFTFAQSMSVKASKPDWGKVLIENPRWNIALDGKIDKTSIQQVSNALKLAGQDGADVFINSPGGDLFAGMQIGRLLRAAGANTYIGRLIPDRDPDLQKPPGFKGESPVKAIKGECHSACALAFLGGVYRFSADGSLYGVHRFYRDSQPKANDLDVAQVISAAIGAFIREMEVDPALFDLMVQQGSDDIRILSNDEQKRLNVLNNGRDRPDWSIEVVQGGQYLRGYQNTINGFGKAVLSCHAGNLTYLSFYEAGSQRATSLKNNPWFHSILVDGKPLPVNNPFRKNATGDEFSVFLPLSREQSLAISRSASVGHAMQRARDVPTFVGYEIEIPSTASFKVSTFINNCLAARK